jgi:predicted transcriptional regulator
MQEATDVSVETDKIFLKEKPAKALVAIRRSRNDIYSRKVSQNIDCTYAHTVKIISNMNEAGLLRSQKTGRKKILQLTSKGERYADALMNMVESNLEEN